MNTTNNTVQKIVEKLDLLPHPEGGFYKENYRSSEFIKQPHLPNRFSGDRNFSTAIYFLLTSGNFSAFHRIQQDEVWHFYEGSPLNVHVITPEGNYTKHKVGHIHQGLQPQLIVPKGCWFASNIDEEDSYTLVGCTVAPGFDFSDFELAVEKDLSKLYPQHSHIINQLTRS
ncbi:cupin domain-containing protein [Pseudofulvibacter geojedonensis]|uniref:Cupin domain-containing protein n=1 Tax=Pseudofulvibacter geojedonensis TaxID=1123758 RepID=A0ABW3HYL1_9FLAO